MKTKILFLFLAICAAQQMYAQSMEALQLAVKNREQTFLGALIDPSSINKPDHQFIDATLNPIIISSSLLTIKSQTITPSYNNMMDFVRKSLEGNKVAKPNLNFSYGTKELKSYNEAAVYFGQNIDPALYFGTSKKTKKTLTAVQISQTFFSLVMDLPDQLCSEESILAQADKLVYVGVINFGRQVLVFIESDFDSKEVDAAVKDIMSKTYSNAMNKIPKSAAIIANSTVRIVLPQGETLEITDPANPLADVMKYMNKDFNADDFGCPINFTAVGLKDNAPFMNEYTIE
ncbi:thiol-activated cytolysin family protein [Phocaeicola sp.]